jgi:hypothetical protein
MRRWQRIAVAMAALGASALTLGLALGMAKAPGTPLPLGDEITIVFKRDIAGVGPVSPKRGARQDPQSTNLTGFLLSADESWACVRVERFVGAGVAPVYDDVWVSRDTILLLVRAN